MMQEIRCPKCNGPMTFHHTTNKVYMSNPPCHEDVIVCNKCKVQKKVIIRVPMPTMKEDELIGYEWV